MKRNSLLILFALFFLTAACQTKPKEAAVNELPDLTITLLDGKKVVSRELSGKNIFIVFFPDCDHCQREAKAIQERIDAFKKYTLYFVATTPQEQIQKFATEYKLNAISNVKFGKIENEMVYRNFGGISTPSLYIYSNEKKLIKKFNGETNVEEIIKFL
jgi:peroxiredoxin